MFRSAITAVALLGAALSSHGAIAAGWHYYDPECPIALGGKSMKFVAMQPKKSIERVCDALPETGATVIALDAPDAELREMTWDIRILRDLGRGETEGDAETVFRLPAQKFRNGMVNFDHNFTSAGNYVLFAKLMSDDGAKEYVGRHHFTVGLMDNTEYYAYVFFALFLLAAGGGFYAMKLRKPNSAPGV